MDAFLGITLSFLVIRWYWKRVTAKRSGRVKLAPPIPAEHATTKAYVDEKEIQRQKDIEDLKKQGYTDDIITMIIPTINNGQ